MKRTQIDNNNSISKRLRTTGNSSININDPFEKFINKFRSSFDTNDADSRPFDIFKQYLKGR
jgi:hypothetical protein